jgi:GNAT superfamily N-acetyltransferase
VQSRRDLKVFIDFPYQHYRRDPLWVPPLRLSEAQKFNPRQNPFFAHAHMQLFLAKQGDKVVGRIAAIDDDNHNQTHGDNICFFGFFESTSAEVAAALLDAAKNWGRAQGRTAIRGPVNPTMNDSCGLQISGFDTPPYIMMPYNPPSYPGYVEQAGFTKIKDVYAWLFETDKGMGERLVRLAERVRRRYKVLVRPVDLRYFAEELARVKALYGAAWEKNWGFVQYTEAEFDHLAKDLKQLIDPDIALFLEIEGEVVGLALALPDANQLFKKMNGRLLPFGLFYLLRARHYIDQARLSILGVLPEYRYKGLELLLIHEIYQRGAAKGYVRGECSWVLEDNSAMNEGIQAAGCTLYKTYRLYQKPL